jgi:CRP-like cAMP-binding protein/HEAT repeat protein
MQPISHFLRVEKGEGRLVALVVSLMFVAAAAMTIGESGIEALFFDRVGARALPAMYVLQGATMFVFMLALTGILGRVGPRRVYLAAPIALGVLVLAERAVLVGDIRWMYRMLWITVALGALVQAIFLWGTAGAVVDTRQAKRLFPIFGAGGILGSVVGGLATRPLAPAIGAANLLFVWTGGLAGAFILCRLVLGRAQPTPRRRAARRHVSVFRSTASEFAYVRRSRMLVWMTAAAVLFSVLFYLLYLPYARAATERFPNADQLAGFFGLFWAAGTGVAFVVSLFVTNRLFAWFGMTTMVIVLTLIYTAAFGVLFVASGFAVLVALRFVNGVWLQGVAQPGWEALTNVVPESRRDQTRAFLNGGPTQMGTMIAGVLSLIGGAFTLSQFAGIGVVTAVVAVLTTIGIRRSYTGALVDALHAGRPQVFQRSSARRAPVALGTDADSARVLMASVRSSDVRVRRLAYQLLADLPPDTRPPDLAEGAEDDDPIVRLAAIRGLDVSTPAGRAALLSLIGDSDSTVSAAAAARGLALTDDPRPALRLRQLLTDPDDALRCAAVEQLAFAPAERSAALASGLLTDPAPQVRATALERLAAAAPDRVLEPALLGLQDPDPAVRIAAGRALGSAAGRRVGDVLAALEERRTTDAAIEAVRRVNLNGDGDGDRVRAFVRSAAARAGHDREVAAGIHPQDDAASLLHDAIVDRGRRVALAGLWAATMLDTRRSEMETAIENLDGAPGQVATAVETLEAAGDPRLLRPLLALWEPADTAPTGESNSLSLAIDDQDEFIRRCAKFVRARREGGAMPGPATALSTLERVLFLRKVPLLADLAPADLERVAQLAEEQAYDDGEVIAAEGEPGEELHIVIEGTIRIVHDGDGSARELATRTAGDVVGEMSIITQAPRIASLVAGGRVRTIRVGRRDFESMLRERPGVALAVMRVLAQRLAEAEARHPDRESHELGVSKVGTGLSQSGTAPGVRNAEASTAPSHCDAIAGSMAAIGAESR